MKALVRSATVGDDGLTVTLCDGVTSFDLVIAGAVQAGLHVHRGGLTRVEFVCTPPTAEPVGKPLNEAPVDF